MMTMIGKLFLPALLLATLLLSASNAQTLQTGSEGAPRVRVTTPTNNVIRYGLGLTFIAGTVEGTDVKEVFISIRRAGTNEEWSAKKRGGSFVKGPTGKWLKTTLDGNNWYAPNGKYSLPTLADLLPAGTEEMRYIIYAYAVDRAGRKSEEEGTMILVRR